MQPKAPDRSRHLVTAAELAELIARTPERVTVLDVRWRMGGPPGEDEYAVGHVPGAAYVALERDLSDPPGDPVDERGRHPLPDPARFLEAMARAGVRAEVPVVVYDDWAGRAAARAWWLLRDAGHSDVRLLDGGWRAWVEGGGTVESGATAPARGDVAGLRPGQLPRVAVADLARFAGSGAVLDAREPERFTGAVEPVDPAAGHVPGARNVPTSANLARPGTFRQDLAAAYAGVPDGPVAVYCGSGVTACHDIFALAILGRDAVLVPGSWSGWTADPARPVATGDDESQ